MSGAEYTPTADEVRLAWWMHVDNPADNEGASDLSFDRWLEAHDQTLLSEAADEIEEQHALIGVTVESIVAGLREVTP